MPWEVITVCIKKFKIWRRQSFRHIHKCELIGQLPNHVVSLGYCFTSKRLAF